MKDYLDFQVDTDDSELVSVKDELSLWSAPFGLSLLDTIKLKKNLHVLDVGCGLGFPLIEIAQRLGNTAKVYGIDPWERVLERVRLKLKVDNMKNVEVTNSHAEDMPFDNEFFDLIVSNNGINNVDNMLQAVKECYRVCRPNGQLTITVNLEKTMIEFYEIFLKTLEENNLYDEIKKVNQHINAKRKPLNEIKSILETVGFSIKDIIHDSFRLRFVDGTTMFNHSLIKYWFLGAWKDALNQQDWTRIFDKVESKLNKQADNQGEIVLTIPFVTIDCIKK